MTCPQAPPGRCCWVFTSQAAAVITRVWVGLTPLPPAPPPTAPWPFSARRPSSQSGPFTQHAACLHRPGPGLGVGACGEAVRCRKGSPCRIGQRAGGVGCFTQVVRRGLKTEGCSCPAVWGPQRRQRDEQEQGHRPKCTSHVPGPARSRWPGGRRHLGRQGPGGLERERMAETQGLGFCLESDGSLSRG